jgi:D-alanyl-D-alanine carboxypeptidase/D-alanyl-D-alanine-endopeptidase (penicillin-binding protein 4)
MIRIAALATLAVVVTVPAAAETAVPLVWHVETADGKSLDSREADIPINPASVVKVATTLWALEQLGPDHRFETRFAIRGTLDGTTGVLDGDLVVEGTADPDFHVENAYLVARALNAEGLRTVRGRVLVDDRFWLGWEGGSERKTGAGSREVAMATRLRNALDPARWDRRARLLIQEFRARAGIDGEPPAVVVEGTAGGRSGPLDGRVLVVHRSNPLRTTLKRFNSYSNNDIERLGESLGTPEELAGRLRSRWGATHSTSSCCVRWMRPAAGWVCRSKTCCPPTDATRAR